MSRARTEHLSVGRRRLPVLGGVGTIERRLDAVRLRLGALLGSGVATRCRPLAGDDQLRPITGAAVAIHAAPYAIQAGLAAVTGRIWDGAGLQITLIGRQVTTLGGDVAPICRHIALHRALQGPLDIGVPLPATTISLFCNDVPPVGQSVAPICGDIALIAHLVALVPRSLPFVHPGPLRQPRAADECRHSPP